METKEKSAAMSQRIVRAVFLLPIFMLVGCAASYDCYPCGTVNCGYCAPNPLPYSNYDSCNCNDSIGRNYLANRSTGSDIGMAPGTVQRAAENDYYLPPADK